MAFTPDSALNDEHRQWLARFDSGHLRNWEKLLGDDPEAASAEADVRRLLAAHGCDVVPNEDLTGEEMRPDFRCSGNGRLFYVEVTHIGIEKTTKVTHLPHMPPRAGRAQHWRPLNDAIFNACRNKTPQCSDLDDPCLVAVCTYHYSASCIAMRRIDIEALLTGDPMLAGRINTQTGASIGSPYEITRLRSAAFLRPDASKGLSPARDPISGVLVCGLGCYPPRIYGVLHPDPIRHFERQLLPQIEFCHLKDKGEEGMLSTEWI